MGKIVYERVNTINDLDSGEVKIVENTVVRRVDSSSEFMQVYLQDYSGLLKLETATESKLLIILWAKSEWNQENTNNGNKVVIIKAYKERWAAELNVSLSTLNNTITSLVKKELLISEERSLYYLNPLYFFKGFSKDRPAVIRRITEYRLSNK